MKEIRLQRICAQIEILRFKMYDMALIYGIAHPHVIEVSRSLDIKVNQYMKLVKEP